MMPVSHRVDTAIPGATASVVRTKALTGLNTSTLATGAAVAFAILSAALSFVPTPDDRAGARTQPALGLRGTLTALKTPNDLLEPPRDALEPL